MNVNRVRGGEARRGYRRAEISANIGGLGSEMNAKEDTVQSAAGLERFKQKLPRNMLLFFIERSLSAMATRMRFKGRAQKHEGGGGGGEQRLRRHGSEPKPSSRRRLDPAPERAAVPRRHCGTLTLLPSVLTGLYRRGDGLKPEPRLSFRRHFAVKDGGPAPATALRSPPLFVRLFPNQAVPRAVNPPRPRPRMLRRPPIPGRGLVGSLDSPGPG